MKKLFFLFTMTVAFASPRFLTDGEGEAGGPTEPKEEETKQDVSNEMTGGTTEDATEEKTEVAEVKEPSWDPTSIYGKDVPATNDGTAG